MLVMQQETQGSMKLTNVLLSYQMPERLCVHYVVAQSAARNSAEPVSTGGKLVDFQNSCLKIGHDHRAVGIRKVLQTSSSALLGSSISDH